MCISLYVVYKDCLPIVVDTKQYANSKSTILLLNFAMAQISLLANCIDSTGLGPLQGEF